MPEMYGVCFDATIEKQPPMIFVTAMETGRALYKNKYGSTLAGDLSRVASAHPDHFVTEQNTLARVYATLKAEGIAAVRKKQKWPRMISLQGVLLMSQMEYVSKRFAVKGEPLGSWIAHCEAQLAQALQQERESPPRKAMRMSPPALSVPPAERRPPSPQAPPSALGGSRVRVPRPRPAQESREVLAALAELEKRLTSRLDELRDMTQRSFSSAAVAQWLASDEGISARQQVGQQMQQRLRERVDEAALIAEQQFREMAQQQAKAYVQERVEQLERVAQKRVQESKEDAQGEEPAQKRARRDPLPLPGPNFAQVVRSLRDFYLTL